MATFKGLDLTGKTAIVTGGSRLASLSPSHVVTLAYKDCCRGIGAAIAILLGQRGANVVVNYTSDKSRQRAMDVVKNIKASGSKATVCQASVANVKEISKIVDAALHLSQNGKIEILVHK